jgi:hypothetical protein
VQWSLERQDPGASNSTRSAARAGNYGWVARSPECLEVLSSGLEVLGGAFPLAQALTLAGRPPQRPVRVLGSLLHRQMRERFSLQHALRCRRGRSQNTAP